jgi:RimJ/RimL family protein N-acetyltransferase
MIEIELRPFGQNDFARLIGWTKSPEFLLQWAGPIFTYPLDQKQLEQYLLGTEGNPPRRRIFKAVEMRNQQVVGHIELNEIDSKERSATLCRVLVGEPSERRNGIGIQMVKKIVEFGFDTLMLHRIDLLVFDFNFPAIQCYEKAGFVKEGHLREVRRIKDEYWSSYLMSILEDEWRARLKNQ